MIVVFGVLVGLQINWNEARMEAQRRQRIIDALVTNLADTTGVHDRFIAEIDAGLFDAVTLFDLTFLLCGARRDRAQIHPLRHLSWRTQFCPV